MPVQFNVIVSGTSVSGDLDTTSQPLTIALGNSDKIGYVHFMLQNKNSAYAKLTGVSGDATISIDAIPASGITQTVFRGNIEQVVPMIDAQTGSQVEVHAYDYGQELMGVISPDARVQSVISGGVVSLVSGDQGLPTLNGMDLVIFVSGIFPQSGATVSSFMAQYYGRSGDSSGSFSGTLFSFKPHISGYTWKTWYYPDASGGVIANDNNVNYWIPIDTHKVKREYAWDALRKLTRQGKAVDSTQSKVAFECYIGVSGDIHVFTSGSYEFLLSGVNGQLTLQYYATGQSGSALNNIVKAKLPNDTTNVKNDVLEWFPALTGYPLDQDSFTDLIAYSGKYWSGKIIGTAVGTGGWGNGGVNGVVILSGNTPYSSTNGFISIQGTAWSGFVGTGTNEDFSMIFTMWSGRTINLNTFNTVFGAGVAINYKMRILQSGLPLNLPDTPVKELMLYDLSGNTISKSGVGVSNAFAQTSGWILVSELIFGSGGQFLSGSGTDNLWKQVGTFDFSNVKQIEVGIKFVSNASQANVPQTAELAIDNMYFSFNYPFSPVVAFNSGSQGMYGRRYAVVEFPYQVTPEQASGLVTNELNSRMGSKQVGDITIKDNPNAVGSVQLGIKPGQVFVIDAPSLNTGSGQTFYYWRAIDVIHEWSATKGFITNLRVVPWFSGALVAPNSNLVDYQLPLQYVQPHPPPDHILFMPGYPYATLV